jgi:hypothetical protein
MADINIYDTIINGYYTFTQYYPDINRVVFKTINIVKTQFPDMTYEDILEKIKLIFISEGFPLPTITDSEILEVFQDNLHQNMNSTINIMHNLLQNLNGLHFNTNDSDEEEDENNDEEHHDEHNEGEHHDEHNEGEHHDEHNEGEHQDEHVNESNIEEDEEHDSNVPVILPSVPFLFATPNIMPGQLFTSPILFNQLLSLNSNSGLNTFLNKKVNVVVDKNVLKKFRNRQYKFLSEKIKDINKNCSICLDDYEETSKVKVLPCEHGFHPECITKWLTSENYTCPVCRKEIGSSEEHKVIDS